MSTIQISYNERAAGSIHGSIALNGTHPDFKDITLYIGHAYGGKFGENVYTVALHKDNVEVRFHLSDRVTCDQIRKWTQAKKSGVYLKQTNEQLRKLKAYLIKRLTQKVTGGMDPYVILEKFHKACATSFAYGELSKQREVQAILGLEPRR